MYGKKKFTQIQKVLLIVFEVSSFDVEILNFLQHIIFIKYLKSIPFVTTRDRALLYKKTRVLHSMH